MDTKGMNTRWEREETPGRRRGGRRGGKGGKSDTGGEYKNVGVF